MKLRNRGIGEDAEPPGTTRQPPTETPKLPTTTTADDYQARQTSSGKGTAKKLRSQLSEQTTEQKAGSKRREISEGESDEEPAKGSAAEPPPPKRLKGKDTEPDPAPVSVSTPAETSESKPVVTWSEKPPIKELTGDEVTTMLEQFEKNLSGWKLLSFDTPSAESSSTAGASAQNVPTAEQKAWNDRVDNTIDKINAGFVAAYTNDTVTSYSVNEQAVGMLIMTNAEIPYITQMATHPGSTGAGGALLEEAVNKSESWGKEGKLRLKPLNDKVAEAYEAWGFKRVAVGMELEPTDNDKWTRKDGDWRLKKYEDQKYLSGFGTEEPKEAPETRGQQ